MVQHAVNHVDELIASLARAHQQLKQLLRQEGGIRWPHHLTMSRLVARSLRRADHTLVRLAPGSDPDWLVGLLVPLGPPVRRGLVPNW